MQCQMSDPHSHKFNIKCGALILNTDKALMKVPFSLLGESQNVACRKGHFLQPSSSQSSTKEGLCNPESPGSKFQVSSTFRRVFILMSLSQCQRGLQKTAQTPHSVLNMEICVKMLPEVVFQPSHPTPGLKLTQQIILIHTLPKSLPSYSSSNRGKSQYKGIWD